MPVSFKPKTIIPFAVFLVLLLLGGIIAITQEASEEDSLLNDEASYDDFAYDFYTGDYQEDEEPIPQWIPPGPPRWFRSNAGGMALEEQPSRLTALRNTYALVIDYISPDEIDPLLQPFFDSSYTVEIHVLYEDGEAVRRQWLFRGEGGVIRLNAVFSYVEPEAPDEIPEPQEITEEADPEPHHDAGNNLPRPAGFMEIYNENSQITKDHLFMEDGEEMVTVYRYNEGMLLNAETERKLPGGEFRIMHTDSYRYNRSFALRSVERLYHEDSSSEPVRQTFPYLILEAAANANFISEKLTIGSDFIGDISVEKGYRMVYDTDARGRVLTQTLYDSAEKPVWVIINTWSDDRILAIKRIEGDDEKLTEYDYDSAGNRIAQRDISNGVLERSIAIDGKNETEELYMNGIVILRAYWEDGRKIYEERVRR